MYEEEDDPDDVIVKEFSSGARGIEVTGDKIDRLIIFANKLRVYILPTGFFEFNVTDEVEGDENAVAMSVD